MKERERETETKSERDEYREREEDSEPEKQGDSATETLLVSLFRVNPTVALCLAARLEGMQKR